MRSRISSLTVKTDDRKVIGLDFTGYRNIGWAILSIDNNRVWLDTCGTIVLPDEFITKNEKDARRRYDRFLSPEALLWLGERLNNVIRKDGVIDVAYERLFVAENTQSVVGIYECIGVIKMLSAHHRRMVYHYTPSKIKSAVTGSGKATKEQVINAVKQLTGVKPDTDHCADAIACAVAHCLHLRGDRNGK